MFISIQKMFRTTHFLSSGIECNAGLGKVITARFLHQDQDAVFCATEELIWRHQTLI